MPTSPPQELRRLELRMFRELAARVALETAFLVRNADKPTAWLVMLYQEVVDRLVQLFLELFREAVRAAVEGIVRPELSAATVAPPTPVLASGNSARDPERYIRDAAEDEIATFAIASSGWRTRARTRNGIRRAMDRLFERLAGIGRNEMYRKAREAVRDLMDRNPDKYRGWVWISQLDRTTCPICWSQHGRWHRRETVMVSHVNCVVGDTPVRARGLQAGASRRYDGEVVRLATSSGRQITVTPNHSILTPRGFVGAGFLRKGDSVCRNTMNERPAVHPDDEDIPSLIHDVVETLSGDTGVVSGSVPVSPVDFHGDGAGSYNADVHVVRPDGFLLDDLQTLCPQHRSELGLLRSSAGQATLVGQGAGAFALPSVHAPTAGGVGGGGVPAVLGGTPLAHREPVRLGDTAKLDSSLLDAPPHGAAGDPEGFGNGVLGLSGEVTLDEVVNVEFDVLSGHVYNLQTDSGLYMCSDIITHNCRCYPRPVAYGEERNPEPKGAELFAELEPSMQRKILGPGKFALYEDGLISLSDLVVRRTHPEWGPYLAEKPLRRLV